MQPLHSGGLRDVIHLIPIMLLVLVVMLIVLIMRIMLVVTNIISHVHTLIPYGDQSSCVGVVFGPTMGVNALIYFLRLSFVSLSSSYALSVEDLQGTPTFKSELRSTQM